MIEQPLSMVTHLVQCKCNGTINNCQKSANGEQRHDDLAPKDPISTVCTPESDAFITWNSILEGLVSHCGRDAFSNSFAINWRQLEQRKVLAPLSFKQNADNIIAGNLTLKRKFPPFSNSWEPPNKKSKLDVPRDNLNSCSILLKRTSARNLILQYKCTSRVPYVKLFDILKEIPQEREEEKIVDKNDFMNIFALDTRDNINTKSVAEVKTSHPIRLTKTVAIPFSSIYGRKLLSRERHCLPEDVALKKIERTDWYLNREAPKLSTDYQPVVSYDKKSQYSRNYHHPMRQFYQRRRKSLKRQFLEFVCKPVCVRLEIIDVDAFLKKQSRTVEPLILSAAEDLANILETNSIICASVLSDSDLVKNVDVANFVDLTDDDYSKCLDVSEWDCDAILDTISQEKPIRRSPRLIANT